MPGYFCLNRILNPPSLDEEAPQAQLSPPPASLFLSFSLDRVGIFWCIDRLCFDPVYTLALARLALDPLVFGRPSPHEAHSVPVSVL